jgi:predicted house-cleaning NTP pyrophosphatase (Maf/HAM1 superfamily)
MKYYKISDFSSEESEAIKNKLAERIKDYVFMVAQEKASEVINRMSKQELIGEDTIEINFQMDFLMNDLLQIVGGFRREG